MTGDGKMFSIKMPENIYAGANSMEAAASIVSALSVEPNKLNIAIITDSGVVKTNIYPCLMSILEKTGACTFLFSLPCHEPSYEDVQAVLNEVNKTDVAFLIGLGGGSVLDCTKLISVLYRQNTTVKNLIDDPLCAHKQLKCLLIPTTCGTGSEATCNAIVSIPEKQIKHGIVNPEMIPEYVILDSVCIEKLPPSIIASTGVDALAHAVECYTSNKHNAVSDTFALAGASLIFHNICTAYDDPSNMVAKSSMLLGAFYGGLAITSSGTTAVHALSYPLGGKFHVPHGISNAVLFAPVMRFNKLFCLPRLASLCDYVYPQNYGLSDVKKAEIIIGRIEYIISHVNIPDGMEKLGVKETDIDFLVKEASQQTRLLSNNCVNLTFDDIRKIYQESMGALNGN